MNRHRQGTGVHKHTEQQLHKDENIIGRDRNRILVGAEKRLLYMCRNMQRTELRRQLPGCADVERRTGDVAIPQHYKPDRPQRGRLSVSRRPARYGIFQLLAQPRLRNNDRQGILREGCTDRNGDDSRRIFRHEMHEGNKPAPAREHADTRCSLQHTVRTHIAAKGNKTAD